MNNRTGKTGGVVVLALLATLTIPSIGYASDAESMRKLAVVKLLVESGGMNCRDRAVEGAKYLREGKRYVLETTLYRGNEYKIIGAGDSDVRDLDIILFDEDLDEIDRDTGTDSIPIVEVSPSWSGTFYIAVVMYSGYGYSNVMICYK